MCIFKGFLTLKKNEQFNYNFLHTYLSAILELGSSKIKYFILRTFPLRSNSNKTNSVLLVYAHLPRGVCII